MYVVAAFTALEGAELLTSALGLPPWLPTVVAVLTIVALPVVAILAWVFDIRDGALQRTRTVAVDGSGPRHEARSWPARLGWSTVVVALLALGGWAMLARERAAALDPGLVAVVPFRATGDGSAAGLDEGMIDLLATKLTGEGGVRAVDPRAVLAAWRRAGSPDTEEGMLEVARELGAARVLLGSVVGSSGRLFLSGRVLDAATGRELGREQRESVTDSLPWLVDRFAGALLGRLGGVDDQRLRLLAGTPLPALKAYLRGQAALRAGDWDGAVEGFGDALAADSTFALAGLYHQIAASFTTAPAGAGLLVAWRNRDRLPTGDRLYLDAVLGARYPDWTPRPERLEGFRRLTRELPDRAEAWYELGDHFLHWVPRPLRDRLPDAREAFQRAQAIDSTFSPAAFHLVDVNLLLDDTAAAGAAARRISGVGEGVVPFYGRWVLAVLAGERPAVGYDRVEPAFALVYAVMMASQHGYGLDEADRAAEAALRRPLDDVMGFQIWSYQIERGRPDRAREIAARYGDGGAEWTRREALATIYAELGAPIEAAAPAVAELEAVAASDRAGTEGIESACVAALYHAERGDHDSALALLQALEPEPGFELWEEYGASSQGSAGRFVRGCAALVDAMAAVASDAPDADHRVDRLDDLYSDGTAAHPWLRDAALLTLARLHERRGDPERALDTIRRRVVAIPYVYFQAARHRTEGDLASRLGRTEEAREAYRRYLELRSDPEDAVRPLVEEVRRRSPVPLETSS